LALDLAVLAVLAVAALAGAASGALRQVASLAAAALGVVAARAFSPYVAAGLAKALGPAALARIVAPALLFLGTYVLASLAASAILRATGVARVVRGPADRACGAILGGTKAALAAWALLSALALAGEATPARLAGHVKGSDFAALARAHNLVQRLDPAAARTLERALATARQARAAGRLAHDPDSARLLEQVGNVEGPGGAPVDPERASRMLQDPELRALAERLAGRAHP
jgi:membrane protein required for colicin V production